MPSEYTSSEVVARGGAIREANHDAEGARRVRIGDSRFESIERGSSLLAIAVKQKEPRRGSFCLTGGQGRNRTTDTRIFSPLLYQLSYLANRVALREALLRKRPGIRPARALAVKAPRGSEADAAHRRPLEPTLLSTPYPPRYVAGYLFRPRGMRRSATDTALPNTLIYIDPDSPPTAARSGSGANTGHSSRRSLRRSRTKGLSSTPSVRQVVLVAGGPAVVPERWLITAYRVITTPRRRRLSCVPRWSAIGGARC